jgi:hypothetical protein
VSQSHDVQKVWQAVHAIEDASYELWPGEDGVTETLLFGATRHLMDVLIDRVTEQHQVLAYLAQESIHTDPRPSSHPARQEFLNRLAEARSRAIRRS